MSLLGELQSAAKEAGLDVFGVSRPRRYAETERLIRERKQAGLFGAMRFTTESPHISCNPLATMTGVASVITCGLYYYRPLDPKPYPRAARIAAFARKDFYKDLRQGLEYVADVLRRRGHKATVLADSNRLTDRPPAVEAGIGRYGKNSMVITYSHGSWVLLGSILTTAALPPGEPVLPDCGSCTACMSKCPTGAIIDDGVIDARKCLAYVLQAPGDIPEELREAVADRLYGCDDCQACCPLNKVSLRSVIRRPGSAAMTPLEQNENADASFWVDPVEILTASDDELDRRFGHFYVPRRDFDHLRRNALVVLGNCGSPQDMTAVEPYLASESEMLRRHAFWAKERIASRFRSAVVGNAHKAS